MLNRDEVLRECRKKVFREYQDGIEFLVGMTMKSVENTGDEIVFTMDDDEVFALMHQQDCCENVRVEDVCGDLSDLVGTTIWTAAEVSNDGENKPVNEYDESYTWTFYKLSTIHGSVTIRFYGTSNGYYSEGVSFVKRS